jgi:hypothetical protein
VSAIFSPCGTFRYRLERPIAESGLVIAFFGVNPSTAGAEVEDQTTMKWRGFCRVNGARRYIAGNPFAFRATEVRELASADDPVGPDNAEHLSKIMADADMLVPCWGSRTKLPPKLWPHLDALAAMIRSCGKPVRIFGLTKSGDPKHPLMLGYDTQFIEWAITG